MQHAKSTAAGVSVPAGFENSFAVTQATWRFFANERVTPQALVEPLRVFASGQIAGMAPPANTDTTALPYVLAVVDWSKLDYKKHSAKHDIVQVSNKQDIGYDLTTQLLVNAQTGQPIAPIQMLMKTAFGTLSTATAEPQTHEHHLEQVLPLMREAEAMKFRATMIHVIDREADSVFHLRAWDAAGFKFLVRGDDDRIVRWRGEHVNIHKIKAQLEAEGAFQQSRNVTIKGKPGVQYVAETEIVLDRPARRKDDGRSVVVPGDAITLRLAMAKVVDPVTGEELSVWHLLTNVPADVSTETIALWYYWRWNIESYFKLMKSGGQELEHWQQESGSAILKRLLVASMACALVWSLQKNESPESEEFKRVLVRLSGKRLKRGHPPTPGILLSGLFVLLRIFDFLTYINFDLSQITQLKTTFAKLAPGLIKNV